jgi:16S rRNA (cytosine967-C5)-methyltransferase
MNLRTAAARILFKVIFRGSSLSDSLTETLPQIEEPRDQALVQAICFGVCRRYYYLSALLDLLLEKGIKDMDQDVLTLLMVGLYQLTDMRIPEYAAVAETVDAVKDFDKVWAKGLVNAVLRNYLRQADKLNSEVAQYDVAYFDHPEWMIGKLKKSWPDYWEDILVHNNEHPPFALRVNQQRGTREEYLEKLAANNIEALSIPETQFGIVLSEPMDVMELSGFSTGDVSVQDGAAQLAAELLELEPGLRVLDACAAPGGKTAHIAEIQKDLDVLVALDQDAKRLGSVTDNLQRLQLSAEIVCADAGDTSHWWDGELFDRILLDAPCSASGVVRRHPDIKLLRRPEDLPTLAKEQLHLLTALWPLLKINGLLLYSTCSIFPQENVTVMQEFLAAHPDAAEVEISAMWGEECAVGRQIFPGMHGMDGFYYARLRKIS